MTIRNMRKNFQSYSVCLLMTACGLMAQTNPTFDVATIKPAAPLDMAKIAAGVKNGQMPKLGPHVDASRAEYTYMALKDLIATAYKLKPYQVSGPDWLANTRFDIVAKMPQGSTKDDAPKMLQALLAERFKLEVHRDSKEHPVLGLVVGKKGPKLKESTEVPEAIDESLPLKPGEMAMDTPDGPVRMTVGKAGSATLNMGKKGTMKYQLDQATMMMHLDADRVTMPGFAEMLTQLMQQMGGVRQVVDMTDLKGNYQVAVDFSLSDLMAMARSQGMDVPAPAAKPGGSAPAVEAASDPGGGVATLLSAVQGLGLKLEPRKAVIEQLVVDHAEKVPTEN